MKHSGRAMRAAWRMIFWTLVLLLAMLASGVLAVVISKFIVAISAALLTVAAVLIGLWVLFAAATLFFFRDPHPTAPLIPNAIVSPAHGTVDLIDEQTESEFMGGPCQRISIFLSLLDVHVQKAPVRGTIGHVKHTAGKLRATMKAEATRENENVLIGLNVTDYPDQKMAVRLIAGVLARRIIPFVAVGESVERSERISLIQYGSRCDFLVPKSVKVHVRLGEKVKGGETIIASFD